MVNKDLYIINKQCRVIRN